MVAHEHAPTQPAFTLIGDFSLDPHEEAQFIVGLYENAIPQPLLQVVYRPQNNGQITASLVRIDNEGDYALTYHFINMGETTFNISISSRWSDIA